MNRFIPGLILIAVAVLVLLNNFGVYSVNWEFLWRLWPLLLVLLGLGMLLGNPRTVWMGVGVLVVLVFLILLAGQQTNWKFWNLTSTNQTPTVNNFTEEYQDTSARTRFELKAGAGNYTLSGTTERLIQVDSSSTQGSFRLERVEENGVTVVRLKQEAANRPFSISKVENNATIRLNSNPVWDIDLETGAANVTADLSSFKLNELDLSAGAASITLTLGDKQDTARVKISTGAASVTVRIPQSVGGEITADTGLSSKEFNGFTQNGSVFRTENFDSSSRKIYLDIDTGLSQIKVERY